MKWKTFLLLSLALLVIIGAFVVPPILLRRSISYSVDKSFLTDASTLGLKPSENIAEKLISLTDPESTSAMLSDKDNIRQLSSMLHRELKTLYDSGAIPKTVYRAVYDFLEAAAAEGLWGERYCVIQPMKHLMFEVYVIQLWDINGQLIFDLSSEKILSMSYGIPDDDLLALEYDEMQTRQELQGWADYLDLNPGEASRTDLSLDEITQPEERRNPVMLKDIVLTDETGISVQFRQTYAFWENNAGYYTWGPKDF